MKKEEKEAEEKPNIIEMPKGKDADLRTITMEDILSGNFSKYEKHYGNKNYEEEVKKKKEREEELKRDEEKRKIRLEKEALEEKKPAPDGLATPPPIKPVSEVKIEGVKKPVPTTGTISNIYHYIKLLLKILFIKILLIYLSIMIYHMNELLYYLPYLV